MAYSVTGNSAVSFEKAYDRQLCKVWEVTETGATNGSEFELSPVPRIGTIVRHQWWVESGNATALNLSVRKATGQIDGSIDDLDESAEVERSGKIALPITYYTNGGTAGGTLFMRSTPTPSTSVSVIKHVFIIVPGHTDATLAESAAASVVEAIEIAEESADITTLATIDRSLHEVVWVGRQVLAQLELIND